MTNREWLESLSDEELAAELDDWLCFHCVYNTKGNVANCSLENGYDEAICRSGTAEWFKAEHKEEHSDD